MASDRARIHGNLQREVLTLVALLLAPSLAAADIKVVSKSANTTVYLGQPFSLLEDPSICEAVNGVVVKQWRDADYENTGTPEYIDWATDATGVVDGNANEIWIRDAGNDALDTTTAIQTTAVSIHLAGDNNDGRARIFVDGFEHAVLDLWANSAQFVQVTVESLPLATHTIRVEAIGDSQQDGASEGADDVAVLGAAAVERVANARGPRVIVVSHGFTDDQLGNIGWVYEMGEALRVRDAANGSVLFYHTGTGEWADCGPACNQSSDPAAPLILLFDWTAESDATNAGGTWGFVHAAADALYAALRDPILPFGHSVLGSCNLHVIGHSRGASVVSETARRLASAGIDVEQTTFLDPHPVDNSPLVEPDYFDPDPRVWTGVGFADNYYRRDLGWLSIPENEDFDGQPVAEACNYDLTSVLGDEDPDDDLNDLLGPCNTEHGKVHAWYHGTIDLAAVDDGSHTGFCAIPATGWYGVSGGSDCVASVPARGETGYYYSPLGGGEASRPSAGTNGVRSAVASNLYQYVVNGDFELRRPLTNYGHAGWRYHGGDKSGLLTAWNVDTGDSSNRHLQLPDDGSLSRTHNRVFVDLRATTINFRHRVSAADGGDTLAVVLHRDGVASSLGPIGLTTTLPVETWYPVEIAIPRVLRGNTYEIEFVATDGGVPGLAVDIDRISFGILPAVEVPALGFTRLAALLAVLGALGIRITQRR